MARITVEDCLSKVPNRFLLVNMVSRRVRQIREGSEYLVNSPKNEDVVVALREIAAGLVTLREKGPEIELDEVPAIAAEEAVVEEAVVEEAAVEEVPEAATEEEGDK